MPNAFQNLYSKIRRRLFNLRYGKQTILIYTMGKVGSSTIKKNLTEQYPWVTVFHVHFLSDHWVKEILPNEDPFFHGNIREAESIYNYLKKNPGTKIKIITLTREPLVRDISDIFQNWKGRLKGKTITDLTLEEIKSDFDRNQHEYTLNWFDTEFKNYLGFDIYSVPFNKEKGYSIYETPKADILCFQLEKLNDCMEEATGKFLGYPVRMSATTNLSENKEGSNLYKGMTGNYAASPEKLDRIYNSKFVQHFYSDADISRFRKKWSDKSADKNIDPA